MHLPYSSPIRCRECIYLIQSGNDLQDLYPASCPLAIKTDQGPTFEGRALPGYQEFALLLAVTPFPPLL